MFCTNCGNQLDIAAKFCTICGMSVNAAQTPQPAQSVQNTAAPLQQSFQQTIPGPGLQQINIHIPPQKTPVKTKWETPRLIIGIASCVLFLGMNLQSCLVGAAEGIANVLFDETNSSGATGYVASFIFLIAGIVSIVCRKNKGGAIAAGVIYGFCAVAIIGADFSYFSDLAFYCFFSLVFAVVMIVGGITQKELH
jgi:hypothetical protein